MNTLGERIKLARGGISQEAFARILSISKGSLGFYERNENLPNVEVILKICSKTGVGLEWLLMGRGPMRPGCATEGAQASQAEGAQASQAEESAVPESAVPSCERCARMESRLDRLEDERRELSAENRRLWKENAELRERCARFEERAKQEGVLAFLEKAGRVCSGDRTENG